MNDIDFAFCGIDAIVYGVEEMALCKQFWLDWGLSLVTETDQEIVFETQDGGEVIITSSDRDDLPEAFESGPTLRRLVWGVSSEYDLSKLREALSTNNTYQEESSGPSVMDPNGMRVTFRVSKRTKIQTIGIPVNVHGHQARIDQRSAVYEKAEPLKIGHVVFFVSDAQESVVFYQNLGFQISDCYPGAGYFMRCKKVGGHHDIFLLQTPDRKKGLNHVAFTVRDLEEVFGGGIHLNSKGWQTQIGPGRHPVSSAYFWYIHNPCGGLAEYYTNEDYCTENWKPQEWERSNENFAEWAISGGIDAQTRRQIKPE